MHADPITHPNKKGEQQILSSLAAHYNWLDIEEEVRGRKCKILKIQLNPASLKEVIEIYKIDLLVLNLHGSKKSLYF